MNVYREKKECCGCGACVDACPKNAVSLRIDEIGFSYPQIDESKCISCGICRSVCGFQKEPEKQTCIKAYAAAIKNSKMLLNSASGGAFYAIAKNFINNRGVVFGAASEYENDEYVVKHIEVDSLDNLKKIQGSKYTQSKTEGTFNRVKELLKEGHIILFSGTPCQISNLYAYLGEKKSKNLYTVDIICHGVPSPIYFNEYIKLLGKKNGGKVVDFKFRDKSRGWGLNAKYTLQKSSGKKKEIVLSSGCSSYYQYFLESEIYRECCYSCKYATEDRVGDITLGDFWGIDISHPEYLKRNGGKFDLKNGISCILVNSDKGEKLLSLTKDDLNIYESSVENIARQNHQLKECSRYSEKRKKLLELYSKYGYAGMDDKYAKDLGGKYYLRQVKNKCINVVSRFKWWK